MIQCFLHCHPLVLVHHQKLSDKVLRTLAYMLPVSTLIKRREVTFRRELSDHFIGIRFEVVVLGINKERCAAQKCSRDATERPHVHSLCVSTLTILCPVEPVDFANDTRAISPSLEKERTSCTYGAVYSNVPIWVIILCC